MTDTSGPPDEPSPHSSNRVLWHPPDFGRIASRYIDFVFKSIRRQRVAFLQAFDTEIRELKRRAESADGEFAEVVSEEAGQTEALAVIANTLILLRTYAVVEGLVSRFSNWIAGRVVRPGRQGWSQFKEDLEKHGVDWDSLPGADELETVRHAVNCLKHDAGRIRDARLAKGLGAEVGEVLEFGDERTESLIASCEHFVRALAAMIPRGKESSLVSAGGLATSDDGS